MQAIDIYRDGALFVTVKLDEKKNNSQNKTIMGENFIAFEFTLSHPVKFKINDYCTVFGEIYKIFDLPNETKVSTYGFRYSMKMKAEGADLAKVQYLFLGPSNTLREPGFSLMGTATDFLNLLLQNLNRVLPGFSIGQVVTTEYKNLTFSKDTCMSALAKVAEAFGTEWWIEGKTIHLTKKTSSTGITFKHGRAKGLYEITRSIASGNSIITRLYPYGSEKNLPPDYGSKRLRLTEISQYSVTGVTCVVIDNGNGTSTFTFDWTVPVAAGVTAITISYRLTGSSAPWTNTTGSPSTPRVVTLPTGTYDFRFISNPFSYSSAIITVGPAGLSSPALNGFPFPYIENNTALYGIIEYTQIFEDIYPRRTGTVTAVDATDIFKFTDSSIDFDVNAQLLPGLTAKVVFNTGQLAGYSFEVSSFNFLTKQFTILKNKDEVALELPSALLKPAIGDKYVLVDIKMPASYIADAENELLQKAQELLLRVSNPQYTYSIMIDPVFIRNNGYSLSIGDEVWIEDSDLEVNRKIRIINTIRNLVREEEYQIQLADTVSQGTITQINNSLSSTQQGLSSLANQLHNSAIMHGKVVGDLKFEQGTAIIPDMPQTPTLTGFETVVIETATGKIYRKV